jgi:8-oxo-dGTP pyrophosphatase MutT (NUDIX family)
MIFWEGFAKHAERQVATVALMGRHGRRAILLMGERKDNGKHTTPGGHLEKGEDPAEGAVREVFEESGVKLKPEDLTHIESRNVTKPGGERLKVHAFKTDFGKKLPKTTTKHDPDDEVHSWNWVDISKGLPTNIEDSLHVPLGRNVLLDNILKNGKQGEGRNKSAFWSGFTGRVS